MALGGEIGVEIGVAEGIDSLFGIAHHEQRPPAEIQGAEDGELQGIGVLKFIDKGGGEATPQCLGQPRQAPPREGFVEVVEHVVIGDHPAPPFGGPDGPGAEPQEDSLHIDGPPGAAGVVRGTFREDQPRRRFAQHAAQFPGEPFRVEARLEQGVYLLRVILGRDAPPVISRRFPDRFPVVRRHFQLEGLDGREGNLVQGVPAERMDGEDRCFLEGEQGGAQTGPGLFRRLPAQGRDSPEEFFHEGIAAALAAILQGVQRLPQPVPDPGAQLRGGGVRESDDQDLIHRQAGFHEEAQVEAADGPGLAGSRGCLDTGDASDPAVEYVQGQRRWFCHLFHCSCLCPDRVEGRYGPVPHYRVENEGGDLREGGGEGVRHPPPGEGVPSVRPFRFGLAVFDPPPLVSCGGDFLAPHLFGEGPRRPPEKRRRPVKAGGVEADELCQEAAGFLGR